MKKILIIWLGLLVFFVFAFEAMAQNTASSTNLQKTWAQSNHLTSQFIFQAGVFNISQGKAQQVNIDGLIGDYFTVSRHHDQNILFGLGYFINGYHPSSLNLMYGINAFYLTHTSVQGNIIQENLFNNLSYNYSITNYPVYAAIKALIPLHDNKDITFDLGVGPNLIQVRHFNESSLDGGVTLTNPIFLNRTTTVLSATVGIGIKFNTLLPFEVGYRFFYLGQGHLKPVNNQVMNNLSTGNSYANALLFSIAV